MTLYQLSADRRRLVDAAAAAHSASAYLDTPLRSYPRPYSWKERLDVGCRWLQW